MGIFVILTMDSLIQVFYRVCLFDRWEGSNKTREQHPLYFSFVMAAEAAKKLGRSFDRPNVDR